MFGEDARPAQALNRTRMPYGDQHMAIHFENRNAKFKRKHFLALASRFAITERAVAHMLDRLLSRIATHAIHLETIGLTAQKTAHLARTIAQRARDLT